MAEEAEKKEEKKQGLKTNGTKKEELTPLQKLLKKSDVLLMLYPKNKNGIFSDNIRPEDEITIYNLVKEKKEAKEKLAILLDTGGGNVYSAVKIMDTLRTKYKEITIIIPQEAKSSGTMMCCGADKLIMGPISELGPLDKPMIHPENETETISALDIVRSIEGMLTIAKDRQKELAREITRGFGVPKKQSLEIAGDSISKLIAPMLCKEDIKIYNQAKRLLVIAQSYATEFLDKYMFKYVKSEKLRGRVVKTVTRRLIWFYPDHSFAIRRNELVEWLFIVEEAEKVDYWEELWKEFEQNLESDHGKIIKFLNP